MNFSRVFVLVLLLIFFSGCTRNNDIKTVNYIKVPDYISQNYRTFHGMVKSQQIAKLSFQTEGKIIFFPYTKGDFVKKGQVVARLDGILYKIRKSEEQARLQDTIIQYNKQKRYYERMDILHKEGGISDNDWEDAYYGLKSLNKQIAIQKEKLNYLDKEISYNILTAPFDGFISEKLSELGSYAQVAQPVLVISGTNKSQIEAMIDSSLINTVDLEEEVIVKTSERKYKGKIAHISKSSIDDGGYLLKINLPEIYDELKDGMSVDVEIPSQNLKTALIPIECIMEEDGNKYVFKIINIKNNIGEIIKEKIKTGQIEDDKIEVLDGISEDDIIISQNPSVFIEHSKVKI